SATTTEIEATDGISLKCGSNVLTIDPSGIHFNTDNFKDNSGSDGVVAQAVKMEYEDYIFESEFYTHDNDSILKIPYVDSTIKVGFESSKPFILGMRAIFGSDIPHTAAKALMIDLQNGLPKELYPEYRVEKMSSDTYGSYSSGVISLNKEEVIKASDNDPKASWFVFRTMIEEMGHHIDYLLRNHYSDIGGDAPMDEGAIFALDYIVYNQLLDKSFEYATFKIKKDDEIEKEVTLKVDGANPSVDEKKVYFAMEDFGEDHVVVIDKNGNKKEIEFFGVRGSGAIHESLTKKAAEDLVHYDYRLDEGCAWPDMPCKDENSIETCYSATGWTVLVSHNEKSKAYQSHHGKNQFWHAMAPKLEGVSYKNNDVKKEIINQACEWFETAYKAPISKSLIHGKNDDGLFHIGKILHMIQDSFTHSHCIRENNSINNNIGAIIHHQGYDAQDASKHKKADTVTLNSKTALKALEASKKIIEIYTKTFKEYQSKENKKPIKVHYNGEDKDPTIEQALARGQKRLAEYLESIFVYKQGRAEVLSGGTHKDYFNDKEYEEGIKDYNGTIIFTGKKKD
uniref:hypothetical protein n=2 Tax=Sulfurimonas sp. TaxID=2022749 RepID=UPI003D12C45A